MDYFLFFVLLLILIYLIYFIHLNNTVIEKNYCKIIEDNLPDNFNGFRILHISDFHNVVYRNNNHDLINDIQNLKPDCIFFTGDMIDSRHLNLDVAKKFAQELVKIAPVYFVTGNHEGRFSLKEYKQFLNDLCEIGFNIINNRKIKIQKNNQTINIYGLEDPRIKSEDDNRKLDKMILNKQLEQFAIDSNEFNILLSHRPEHFDLYSQYNFDIIFSGHAHGGQIRLPLIGPLYAPNQGLFPKYTTGIYSNGISKMVVNRGSGPSRFPVRFNNHPEIILVQLYRK